MQPGALASSICCGTSRLLGASRAEAPWAEVAPENVGNVQHAHDRAAPGLLSSSGTPSPCHADMSDGGGTDAVFPSKLLTTWRRCCLAELTSTTGANLGPRSIPYHSGAPVPNSHILRSQQQASEETHSLHIEMQSQRNCSILSKTHNLCGPECRRASLHCNQKPCSCSNRYNSAVAQRLYGIPGFRLSHCP